MSKKELTENVQQKYNSSSNFIEKPRKSLNKFSTDHDKGNPKPKKRKPSLPILVESRFLKGTLY